MVNETDRRRSIDQSRSGRVVIFVQIAAWCAVGTLLLFRGVATLNVDEPFSNTDNRTTTVLVTARDRNDTNTSRAIDENEGNLILRVFGSWYIATVVP
jgi:hypothetical protein